MTSPLPRVLFIVAHPREAAPLEAAMASEAPPYRATVRITGVGKAAAAVETTLALAADAPALVVQVGCAGAYPGSGLAPGDVAIAEREILADEGVAIPGGFLDLEALGLSSGSFDGERLHNEVPVARPRFETWKALLAFAGGRFTLRQGRFATVSTVTGTAARASELEGRWHCVVESMEGAAAALAAARLAVRFFEVRGVSNLAGPRDREAWQVDLAASRAAEVAILLAACELGALTKGTA